MNLLTVRGLSVKIGRKSIINKLNLSIKTGQLHLLMGPNGSGKSSLAQTLAGHSDYHSTGEVRFQGKDLLKMQPEERALAGLFLGFQQPATVAGLGNAYFIKAALNQKRIADHQTPLDASDFLAVAEQHLKRLNIKQEFLTRSLNDGFSGGEKKRNEILQMVMLKPRLAILDEIDSGVDRDALKIICATLAAEQKRGCGILLISHNPGLLSLLKPDRVHILDKGRIRASGSVRLAKQIEQRGFKSIKNSKALK